MGQISQVKKKPLNLSEAVICILGFNKIKFQNGTLVSGCN